MKVETVCRHCGVTFLAHDYELARGKNKCCSQKCANLYRTGKPGVKRNKPALHRNNPERFWAKVKMPLVGCWEWQCSINRHGYGALRYEKKAWLSHRLAYSLAVGSVPDGLCVLHKCDNRKCCNPAHLFLGTNDDNVQDRNSKGRTPRGEKSGTSKLKDADVIAIRATYKPFEVTKRMLADRFSVSFAAIDSIISRRTWKHI